VHAVVELLAHSPNIRDRIQACEDLMCMILTSERKEDQQRAMKEFLKTRGDRVISWLENGDLTLPPLTDESSKAKVKKTTF
jgi:hypothetical protein